MLEICKSFIANHKLCFPKDKILVAVSGGIDSIVLLDILYKLNFNITLAHCNFQLRGKESDDDEKLVKSLSEKYGIEFFLKRFNTKTFAEENRISIQMAARKLRYDWFNKTIEENSFNYVAIAHNKDDVAETFFINLLRGTGIRGLTGIKEKTGNIIRPIIFASRKEIEQYCKTNNLVYREDKSNESDDYLRNRIRHHLIPLLKEIKENSLNNIDTTILNLQETLLLFNEKISEIVENIVHEKNDSIYLNKNMLNNNPAKRTILYEIAKNYNFSSKMCDEIIEDINKQPGTKFISETHQITIDRDFIIISSSEKNPLKEYYIQPDDNEIHEPIHLLLEFSENTKSIVNDNNIACLDFDLLKFPLKLRNYLPGDKFKPLGMKGMKKLSDFFTDKKIPLPEKQKIWILLSDEKIVWVVNHRIDDRYKLNENTKRVVKIKFLPPKLF
ncbi:MAG: tRNA lysidine(34) synthetase TilS [Bacteroidales bacterium]|nr:tRNA lysidine(34) synthetase TilS [Bacteroidales bacterium]